MKNAVIILMAIFVFFLCAIVGYQLATQSSFGQDGGPPMDQTSGNKGEQHNLIVVHVDQLDSPQPQLISVWFVQLFFFEGTPPTITFAQIYPTRSESTTSRAIERSYSLSADGEPAPGFWQSIRALNVNWEGFLVVDQMTMDRILAWANGPSDISWVQAALRDNPEEIQRLLKQTCKSVGGIDRREADPFSWGDLVPAHFHSNLRMEAALAYWEKVTNAEMPIKCEVVPPD